MGRSTTSKETVDLPRRSGPDCAPLASGRRVGASCGTITEASSSRTGVYEQ